MFSGIELVSNRLDIIGWRFMADENRGLVMRKLL
jgi:hypothetical protein